MNKEENQWSDLQNLNLNEMLALTAKSSWKTSIKYQSQKDRVERSRSAASFPRLESIELVCSFYRAVACASNEWYNNKRTTRNLEKKREKQRNQM